MSTESETTILEEGYVKITNLRAIIGTKTYAMSNVTSVSLSEKPGENWPILCIILGGMVFCGGILGIREYWGCILVGAMIVGLGIYAAKQSKRTYSVKIGSASGEANLLEAKDRAYIQRIVDAVNQAIILRG